MNEFVWRAKIGPHLMLIIRDRHPSRRWILFVEKKNVNIAASIESCVAASKKANESKEKFERKISSADPERPLLADWVWTRGRKDRRPLNQSTSELVATGSSHTTGDREQLEEVAGDWNRSLFLFLAAHKEEGHRSKRLGRSQRSQQEQPTATAKHLHRWHRIPLWWYQCDGDNGWSSFWPKLLCQGVVLTGQPSCANLQWRIKKNGQQQQVTGYIH